MNNIIKMRKSSYMFNIILNNKETWNWFPSKILYFS
jgi:hypothetical protein